MSYIQEIYENIKDSINKKGFYPSGKQIAEDLKIDYETEVKPAIAKLVEEGKVKIDEIKDKIIEILD